MSINNTKTPAPQNANGYIDPYRLCATTCRIQAEVDAKDFHELNAVRATKGTIQTTVNLLFSKLIYELKRRNITDYTHKDEFERFISECHIISADEWKRFVAYETLNAGSVGRTSPERTVYADRPANLNPPTTSSPSNVGSGTPLVGGENAPAQDSPPINESGTPGGRSGVTGTTYAFTEKAASKSKRTNKSTKT